MEKKLIILVALFVICFAGSALALESQWLGWAGDRAWTNPANWNAGSGPVPGPEDKAKVNGVLGNLGPIISTPGVRVGEIFISEGSPELTPQTLTVAAGGEVTTGSDGGVPYSGQVNIGYASHNTGTIIMDGGTMNISGHLWLGWAGKGILQMNSGTLNVGTHLAPTMFGLGWGGPGNDTEASKNTEIHCAGGLLHTTQWWGATDWLDTHNYTFDITEGTWEIHGWWENELNQLKGNGWITGYGSADNVVIAWDSVRELIVVTAIIPEPITLSLLGLGALLLRKR